MVAEMLSQDEINALLMQAGGGDLPDLGGGLDSAPAAAPAPIASAPAASAPAAPAAAPASMSFTVPQTTYQMPAKGDLGLLADIPIKVSVFLGKTKMPLKDALKLGKGSIVEIDKLKGEPVDVYLNNQLFARGEIVVVDENFGIRLKKIIDLHEREELLKRS
ncbi:MAG TPA: flagellar motor switch protein FliN [bacterium]|nr:flagellar motor switch protein FliN [bacterium]